MNLGLLKKFKMAAKETFLGNKKSNCKHEGQISVQITLPHSFCRNVCLHFTPKFMMAAKNGRKTYIFFWKNKADENTIALFFSTSQPFKNFDS